MATIVLDLYDIGVRISDESRVIIDSEGYALIESEQSIITGEQAKQHARLRPREITTQFWGELSSHSKTKLVVSNAELAYWHLHSIWRQLPSDDHEVIIITPNTVSKQDLGLLLGICEKLSINVVGIVSNAVLALPYPLPDCKVVYLDLLQHRIALTEITFDKENIKVQQPQKIIGYGFHILINNLAKTIARKFISETRFDPMHLASDEQQFFDKLPLWLNALENTNSVECSLSNEVSKYAISLDKEYLLNANKNVFSEITNYINIFFHNHETIAIVCSPSCSQVFGLLDYLKTLPGCAIISKEKLDVAVSALQHKKSIKSDGNKIHYTTTIENRFPASSSDIKFNSGTLSRLTENPTHLLLNNQAYSLHTDLYIAKQPHRNNLHIQTIEDSDAVCKISSNGMVVEVKKLKKSVITLNGEPLNEKSLVRVGDSLYIFDGALPIIFIRVHGNEASNY